MSHTLWGIQCYVTRVFWRPEDYVTHIMGNRELYNTYYGEEAYVTHVL